MKNIALFGASGRTGKPLLSMLLTKGYRIKALVREPSQFQMQHPNLQLLQGNILSASDVENTVIGADAVISVIGHVKGDNQSLTVQSEGIKHILKAMEKQGIKRLISLTGGAVPFIKDKPKFVDKAISFIMSIVAKDTLNDAIEHAKIIQQSSTDWTIVRGPRLLEQPPRGKYRVGFVGINASTSIAYGDLALFILEELQHPQHIRSMPFVSH